MAQQFINPVLDSWMDQRRTGVNFGAGTGIALGIQYVQDVKLRLGRPIGNFDLTLLAGATIVAAELRQYLVAAGGTNSGRVARCTRPADWVESEVTWDEFNSGNSWTAGGGDFDQVTPAFVAFTLPNATGLWRITGLVGHVNDAINNRNNICSLILKVDDEDPGDDQFATLKSREHADGPERWQLVVNYIPVAGGRWSMRNYG